MTERCREEPVLYELKVNFLRADFLCLAMKIIRLSTAIDLFHTLGAIPNAYLKKES